MNPYLRMVIVFVLLLVAQVYVMDNIFIFRWGQPFIFFYFILLIPAMQPIILLPLVFVSGLILDGFTYSPGVHSATLLVLAFSRIPLVRIFKLPDGDELSEASLNYLGFRRYFFYLVFISLLFHTIKTFLIVFSLEEFGYTLLRILINTSLSVAFLFLFEILFFYKRKS